MIEPINHPFTVYYCRHGQTDWNKEDRLQGHADIPLNEHGRKQARAYGRAMARMGINWDEMSFYVSPLNRAVETLELLLEQTDVSGADIVRDERLIELDLGDWNGRTIREIEQLYPAEWAARKASPWLAPVPGGESYGEAEPRLRAFAQSLKGPSLIVGHGGTGRVFRGLLTNGDPAQFLKTGTRQDRIYVLEKGREDARPSLF
ncbi:histidine phosphatase family protein [Parvularcula sp. IMCC14364]|uniref:histidine phosphatase family protein n=1 Tax=Parvularcula sp. IMCC14364 TaxID=3067902 RepID=UPI002740DEAE|nr:histidine phosphatase family protein [Parvularcula sp. IMCC14364]